MHFCDNFNCLLSTQELLQKSINELKSASCSYIDIRQDVWEDVASDGSSIEPGSIVYPYVFTPRYTLYLFA